MQAKVKIAGRTFYALTRKPGSRWAGSHTCHFFAEVWAGGLHLGVLFHVPQNTEETNRG